MKNTYIKLEDITNSTEFCRGTDCKECPFDNKHNSDCKFMIWLDSLPKYHAVRRLDQLTSANFEYIQGEGNA